MISYVSVKSSPAAQNTTTLRILTFSCQAITLRPRRRPAVAHLPSPYLSLLEEPARGSLPLDVAPAEQHKDRETRNYNGQKSADDTGGDHGKTRAERHGEARFKHATGKLK